MKCILSKIIMSFITILMTVAIVILCLLVYKEFFPEVGGNIALANANPNTSLVFGEDDDSKENISTPKLIESTVKLDEGSSTPRREVNYNNVQIDKYFYNQLNDYSKTIYKALESNKENMKTGTARVDLGTSFSDLLSQDDGGDLLGQYYQSAIEAYTYDNVDVFYFDVNHMFLNIETTTRGTKVTYNVFINNGNASSYLSSAFSSKEDVDRAISAIEQERDSILRNKSNDTYSNIKMVHDYLVNNLEYDTSISENNIYNLYGGLVTKRCVCEGYAKAFKYLMDSLGIPCTLVLGGATNSEGAQENHEWNYVKIGGKWYAIDCTWDDPIVRGNRRIDNSIKYKYFLKGSSEFNQNHSPDGRFTSKGMLFTYPTISSSNYN